MFISRYITQDPLGILGGLNSYQYAGSDPINWFDPLV
nr:RHS repeat-associated core domain-containing protein [Gilliamella apicola]